MYLPLGGYKGYGLALMVEVLCGILSGAAFGPHVLQPATDSRPSADVDVGHFFLALDIARFMPVEPFKARMKQMVDEIHACQPAPGVSRIYVPGERAMETIARRRAEGIPMPMHIVADLKALGEQIGEPFALC